MKGRARSKFATLGLETRHLGFRVVGLALSFLFRYLELFYFDIVRIKFLFCRLFFSRKTLGVVTQFFWTAFYRPSMNEQAPVHFTVGKKLASKLLLVWEVL